VAPFDVPLADFGARVDELRQHLYYADPLALTTAPMRRDSLAQMRAACYVWVASALERFIHSFIDEMIGEINSAAIRARDLRLSLFAIACGNELDRLRDIGGLKMWDDRAVLFDTTAEPTPALLNVHQKPMDGRTIEPRHLTTVWAVFGLTGTTVPHPRHELALIDLSRARNDLAHGQEEPVRFGRTKTTADVHRTIDLIEEIVLHVTLAGGTYLAGNGFRR
jgi:hypothetical protein